MATQTARFSIRSGGISLSLAVLALITITLGVLGSVTYRIGRGLNTETRFFYAWDRPTGDEACAACAVEYALRTDDANDVIFLGDSTCRTGIDPRVFERLTGLTAYNLGSLRGVGASGFVITLKAYLLHHPRPRAVVLCVTPTCFEVKAGTLDGPLAQSFASNYGPEVSEIVPLTERIAYFCKRGLWKVWKPRDQLVDRLHGQDVRDLPLKGLDSETYHTLQRKSRDGRGFFSLPGTHGSTKMQARGGDVLIQEEWNRGIRRVAEQCEAANVPLVIRFAPVTANASKARNFEPLEAWSQDLQSSYPRTTVGRPIVRSYDPALMWDSIHLNSAGVERFVSSLADDVRGALNR
jgi:hypothetical protein